MATLQVRIDLIASQGRRIIDLLLWLHHGLSNTIHSEASL